MDMRTHPSALFRLIVPFKTGESLSKLNVDVGVFIEMSALSLSMLMSA